jgi:hypothetical protein
MAPVRPVDERQPNRQVLLLFYAGMGNDKAAEHIGLARSTDGRTFQRVAPDGLVLPTSAEVPWRDLRVCNPTVLSVDESLVMFFQGISRTENVSIGRAESPNGEVWECNSDPSLSWAEMQALLGGGGTSQRTAVFEPSLLREDGLYRMWFCYLGSGHTSHSLFYAESETGEEWEIEPQPLLSGSDFGFCLFHYPQVVRREHGYELYFTLRSARSGIDGIYRMHSADGLSWHDAEVVLGRWELGLARSGRSLAAKIAGRAVRPLNRLLEASVYRGVELGYGHPHVVDSGGETLLFWQKGSRTTRGRVFAIGASTVIDGRPVGQRLLLGPSRNGGWDSFFVADPYVLRFA